MQQWTDRGTSAQWDVSLTQLLGLKHLSPGAEVSKLCRHWATDATWPPSQHHNHSV